TTFGTWGSQVQILPLRPANRLILQAFSKKRLRPHFPPPLKPPLKRIAGVLSGYFGSCAPDARGSNSLPSRKAHGTSPPTTRTSIRSLSCCRGWYDRRTTFPRWPHDRPDRGGRRA